MDLVELVRKEGVLIDPKTDSSYTHLFIKGNKNAAKAVVLYEI